MVVVNRASDLTDFGKPNVCLREASNGHDDFWQEGWCSLQRLAQVAKTTVDSIQTACKSLSHSEFCAHQLDMYESKVLQLEQLHFE